MVWVVRWSGDFLALQREGWVICAESDDMRSVLMRAYE